jgi:hypothetical protein
MRISSAWRLGMALALLRCGDKPESVWTGAQTCSVGIPPVGVSEEIASVQVPVNPDVLDTADGFSLRDFTLGPIAGFSCWARQVDVVFTTDDGLTRGIAVGPFDCLAPDGRTYTLIGEGAADVRAAYFSITFSPWLDLGQAIVVCTTTLRRGAAVAPDAVVPDAGVTGPPVELPL